MLRIAQKLAAKSHHRQHHHGVIITRGSKIIATGYNHKHLHAEEDALRKVITLSLRTGRCIKGITLYSFRWRKGGTWGNAKPCQECTYMIETESHYTIAAIFYTNEKGELTKL